MGNFFGGLFGGLGSIVSGIFGANATASANAANIAEQNFMAGGGNLPALVRNAKAAGLNPLAVLGQTGGGGVSVSPVDPMSGVGDASQNIGRALAALDTGNDRLAKLQEKKLESDIAQNDAITAGQVLSNMRTMFPAGAPKGVGRLTDNTEGLGKSVASSIQGSFLDPNVLNNVFSGTGMSIHQWLRQHLSEPLPGDYSTP